MEPVWQNLLAPEIRVCGRWVRAYTLWHHLLLSSLRSPFLGIDDRTQVTPYDLLTALRVVSVTFPHRPYLVATPRDYYWLCRFLLRPRTFPGQAARFLDFLRTHLSGPLFWKDTSKSNGQGFTAPEVYSLVYGLTSKARLTEAEAWRKSPGQAVTILATVAELEGATISFLDPADLEELRNL